MNESAFTEHGVVCPECRCLLPEIESYVADLAAELASARVGARRQRGEQRKHSESDPLFGEAMEVLALWKELCAPRTKELNGPRLEKTLARLHHGYDKVDLIRCVHGYASRPFVTPLGRSARGLPGQRHVDAGLIFGDAKHVDAGLDLFERLQAKERRLPKSINERSLSEFGRAALRYARAGFYVFPIRPGSKAPATAHGLLDATTDDERIARFWLAHPDYNVAIRCGLPSQIIVLDVDGEEGYASLRRLIARLGELPPTASVKTPRGGEHYYFRHPLIGEVRNTTGVPDVGLDVRGDGGYVLAPPSLAASGRGYVVDDELPIAPIPEGLLCLLVERQAAAANPKFRADYAQMVRSGARKGERNSDLLKLAGHLWSHGHEAEEVLQIVVAVNEARCLPPLTHREVEKIVGSVRRMRARQQQALV
jgi:hypothetical protein